MDGSDSSSTKKLKVPAPLAHHEMTPDDQEDDLIGEFGYVAVYRRIFRSLGNMCLVISLTSPFTAIMIQASYQIMYAGYWGLSWGWIIPNFVMLPEVLAICELSSSMPLNGAFYWWTGALAPPRWSHALSYISGWLNILQIFAATASFAFAVASAFAYGLTIAAPGFNGTESELMALSMAVVILWAALMCMKLERISMVYIAMAILILVQTLIYIIGLPATRSAQGLPFASAREVFTSFENFSDWDPAVAVPYSWFCVFWVNSAWMVPVYMSEETHNAAVEIPKSLLYTFTVTAISGLVVCVVSAFCITDIAAMANSTSGYPLMDMVVEHWGRTIASAFFLFITPVGFIGGSGTLLTYASQIAAFARDGGFPWAAHFAYVHPRLNLPIYSLGMLSIGTFLVLLLSLSSEASTIIYSLSVIASLITYIIPIGFRIFAGDRWVAGPFDLGRWSIPIHVLAFISQSYMIVMQCFPPQKEWDATTLNYNFAITLLAAIFSCLLYIFYGKKHFKGLDTEAVNNWRRHHLANSAFTATE